MAEKQKLLPVIHANAGIAAEFQRKLEKMIAEMNKSVTYWLTAAYRATPPEMATDASPAKDLQDVMKKLARKWNKKFADAAPDLARYFATAAKDRTDGALRAALKKSGMAVEFKVTKEINDILQATVVENVSLIKTISQEYLADVEQMVMRSVTVGRDLGGLRQQLQDRYGITHRRAKLIARQSNNNATAMLRRARETELGVTEAVWVHSHAGRVPRPEHEAWNGKRYKIKDGMYSKVSQKYVWPGTDFNCLPGNSIIEFAAGCKKLWRRRYSGQLSQLITASGKTINATPNHPIFTNRGWVAIQSVNLGDDVIGISDQIVNSLYAHPEGEKTTFSELFCTISEFLLVKNEAASGSEFHGDITDSEIETINIDSFLGDEFDSTLCQNFCELFFPNAIKVIRAAGDFEIDSALYSTCSRLFSAPESVVRGFCTVLSLLKSHSAHADDICLRLTADLNIVFGQVTTNNVAANGIIFRKLKLANTGLICRDDQIIGELFNMLSRASIGWQCDAPFADMTAYCGRMQPDAPCSLLDAHSIDNKFDRIVDKRFVDYVGHVYNLENEVNWYSNQSYIIHNCRCGARSVLPTFGRAVGEK